MLQKKVRTFKKENIPKPLPNVHVPLDLSSNWDLEIGSGHGEFALSRALKFPDRKMIAIEKTRNKIKSIQNTPSNLWFLHTNAVWWISHFIPKNFLDHIFILYPNTYPKNKQANMRWVNRPFFTYLMDRLKFGGQLEIRTNEDCYYQETKEKLEQNFPWMRMTASRFYKETHVPQTLFEKKYLNRRPVWRIQLLKV